MNKQVRNERRKLTAAFANGIAVASVGVGGLTQAATMVQMQAVSQGTTGFIAVCLLLAACLHWAGRASLRGIEE